MIGSVYHSKCSKTLGRQRVSISDPYFAATVNPCQSQLFVFSNSFRRLAPAKAFDVNY